MPQNLTVPDLFQALREEDRVHAMRWWDKISVAEREELSVHWEESLEKETKGLILIGFDADRGYIFKGNFREGDDIDFPEIDNQDLIDYYLNNIDQLISITHRFHVGGVCMAHPAARACLDQGRIPNDFKCPLGDHDCRMAAILAKTNGRSVHLELIGSC